MHFGMGHYAAIDNQKRESKGRVIVDEWVLEIKDWMFIGS